MLEDVWDARPNVIAIQETCLSDDDYEAYNNVDGYAGFFKKT